MKKLQLILGISGILTCSTLFGQAIDPNAFGYYTDALRFSQTSFGGTTRFQSIGGANTALGGDISSAHTNPAGLGFNRKSEFSITPTLGVSNSTSTIFNSPTEDSRFNVNFNSLGVVFASTRNGASRYKGGSFAITMTRLNDFQQNASYQGVNDQNSMIDFFLEQSDANRSWGYFDDMSNAIFDINALGYYTYLINPDYQNDEGFEDIYFSFIPVGATNQQEEIRTRGAQYQWSFAYGGNYDDRLYFGVSLGVQSLRYELDKEYSETPLDPSPLNSLIFTDRLIMSGTGINLTGGLIYRLNDVVRLGLSATSPTAIRISETYTADLLASYNNFIYRPADYIDDPDLREAFEGEETVLGNEFSETIPLEAEYTLITPFRVNAGMSVFIGKNGFLSADVEYIGYSNATFTGGDNSGIEFDADNNTIENLYSNAAYNLRLGGEWRIQNFRLRGGFAYYDSPYSDESIDESSIFLTGGVGYRSKDYYFDFGIVHNAFDNEYSPYTLFNGSQPSVAIDYTKTRAMFSFGVFF